MVVKHVLETLDNICQQYILTKVLMRYCSIIKNEKYDYEKEYLPKQALNRVVLGPLTNAELSKDSLKEFLDSKGFNLVNVILSKAPYDYQYITKIKSRK